MMLASEFRNWMLMITFGILIVLVVLGLRFWFTNYCEYFRWYLFGMYAIDFIGILFLLWLFLFFIGAILIEVFSDWLEDRKEKKHDP